MKHMLIAVLVLFPSMAWAGNVDDKKALGNLTSLKMVCDVNVGEAKLLLRRLELIDETYSQLIDAGVTPTVVVAFRGGASLFVTQGAKYIDPGDAKTKREIQGWVDQFNQHGFRIEQCAIAAKAQKVDPADFLPAVTVVQNGYISIVAYQARGYALLPMD
ncbi:DsrE family protein [Desulfosarcina sp.]|uniref:DsrE family protein n=1 Tax=Desulfosarcina sp. TaxID=2027861 RepID=UPI0035630139